MTITKELLEALKLAEESLGEFVSDHGWSQRDMDILDTVIAAIAKAESAVSEPVKEWEEKYEMKEWQVHALRAGWSAPPAAAVSEPVAYMRKWAYDKETPTKERKENGRMAWPFKFKLLPLTPDKCLNDDVPLYATPPAEAKREPLTKEQIVNAMCEDGCERIESFYHVGPVQKAAVWSFAQAIHNIGAKEC